MSGREPGLDLHVWETRWAELEEALEADARATLPLACDLIADFVGEDFVDVELDTAFKAARETADRIERGEDVAADDVSVAIENLRTVRDGVRAGRPEG